MVIAEREIDTGFAQLTHELLDEYPVTSYVYHGKHGVDPDELDLILTTIIPEEGGVRSSGCNQPSSLSNVTRLEASAQGSQAISSLLCSRDPNMAVVLCAKWGDSLTGVLVADSLGSKRFTEIWENLPREESELGLSLKGCGMGA